MANLKWLFGILLVLACGLVGFFIGKSIYDLPIPPPPDPVFIKDTVYTEVPVSIDENKIKREYYHRGYLEGISVPKDTLYHPVDSLGIYETLSERFEEEYETTFNFEPEYFDAKFILYSTIGIRSTLTREPEFKYQWNDNFTNLIVGEYNNGYQMGYKEGRNNISFWKKLEYGAYGALGFILIKSTVDLVKDK